jgi:hypothetical protein
VDHPQEVVGMSFPAGHDATKVVIPGEEAFDFPAASRAAQRATVLGPPPTVRQMPGNHLDAVCRAEVGIQAIAVVPAIADQSRRELVEEARGERRVNESDFMRRSTGHVDGDRKTMAVANRHDFAAFTASSRADGGAPFFAELKLASMKASLRSSLPRSRKSSARPWSTRSNSPVRCHV